MKRKKKSLGPDILTHVTEGFLITNWRSDFRKMAMAGRGLNPVLIFIQIQRIHS